VTKEEEKKRKRVGYVQPTPTLARHTGLSGAPGWPAVNWLLSGKRRGVRLKFTGLSGGAPDCPVSQRSPAPMVGRAICGRHVARSNDRLGTPDCPVCTGQCPVRQSTPRTNDRMRQIWKGIAHRTAIVIVRWCTGLSGAPPDRRQVWPSKLASHGS
jgi:hypothetical protein